MFSYTGDICRLAQDIVTRHVPRFETALDATLGNGRDTRFLLDRFTRVFAFDIQERAVAPWRDRDLPGLTVVCDSHANLKATIDTPLDCAMFNLGYLPGGDKSITTEPGSTAAAINATLDLLAPGALMTIAVYVGHPNGPAEAAVVCAQLAELDPRSYGTICHKPHNRSEKAPFLMVVEKAREGPTYD